MSESFPRAFQSWRDRAGAYKETDVGAREEGWSARAAGTTTAAAGAAGPGWGGGNGNGGTDRRTGGAAGDDQSEHGDRQIFS